MRLRDFFIVEGLKDKENRELAQLATDTLIDNVERIKAPHTVARDDDNYVTAVFRGWDFENIPKEVHHLFSKTLFFISAIPPDEPNQVASMYHNSKLKVDSLFVYYKPAGANVTEAAWKKYIEYKGAQILRQKYNPIVHEFIHLMDSQRLSDPTYMDVLKYDTSKLSDKSSGEMKKYVNEPLEFNAYFHQFTELFDYEINKAGSLRKLGINSARDMVSYGFKNIPDFWLSELSPELKRHLVKRLTQFWYDMRDKYG